jgi:hypothetical protein
MNVECRVHYRPSLGTRHRGDYLTSEISQKILFSEYIVLAESLDDMNWKFLGGAGPEARIIFHHFINQENSSCYDFMSKIGGI